MGAEKKMALDAAALVLEGSRKRTARVTIPAIDTDELEAAAAGTGAEAADIVPPMVLAKKLPEGCIISLCPPGFTPKSGASAGAFTLPGNPAAPTWTRVLTSTENSRTHVYLGANGSTVTHAVNVEMLDVIKNAVMKNVPNAKETTALLKPTYSADNTKKGCNCQEAARKRHMNFQTAIELIIYCEDVRSIADVSKVVSVAMMRSDENFGFIPRNVQITATLADGTGHPSCDCTKWMFDEWSKQKTGAVHVAFFEAFKKTTTTVTIDRSMVEHVQKLNDLLQHCQEENKNCDAALLLATDTAAKTYEALESQIDLNLRVTGAYEALKAALLMQSMCNPQGALGASFNAPSSEQVSAAQASFAAGIPLTDEDTRAIVLAMFANIANGRVDGARRMLESRQKQGTEREVDQAAGGSAIDEANTDAHIASGKGEGGIAEELQDSGVTFTGGSTASGKRKIDVLAEHPTDGRTSLGVAEDAQHSRLIDDKTTEEDSRRHGSPVNSPPNADTNGTADTMESDDTDVHVGFKRYKMVKRNPW